jgi:hypothetical protein
MFYIFIVKADLVDFICTESPNFNNEMFLIELEFLA